MIVERIEKLCEFHGTTITALCKEITGSSGNLSTWRKDNIRPLWLREICKKFQVSGDYILCLDNEESVSAQLGNADSHDLVAVIDSLSDFQKGQVIGYIQGLLDGSVAADQLQDKDLGKAYPSTGTEGPG